MKGRLLVAVPVMLAPLWLAACDGGGGAEGAAAGGSAGAAAVGDTAGAAGSVAARGSSPAPSPAPRVETVAEGLEVPWDLAFAPDGRIFVTERPGRIRVIDGNGLRPEPWAELGVAAVGEAGLTSIALGPDFPTTGRVLVLGTFRGPRGLENRVVALTERDGGGADARVLIDGLPAGRIHAGSALDFGPDGMLYVTVGDASEPGLAQDGDALNGKLLRYAPDGTIPSDNPTPGSPVLARGLRNSQGLDWRADGALLGSEHGPSGLPWENGRTGRDELNRLTPGGNYGWPEVAGRGAGERFAEPLAVWDPAIAPSGLAVYRGEEFPAWRGHAFLGGLRGRQLRRVGLEASGGGLTVTDQEALFRNEYGRIRAVVMGPDGRLYFTTSNRDGRGDPGPRDDRVLRIVPGGG